MPLSLNFPSAQPRLGLLLTLLLLAGGLTGCVLDFRDCVTPKGPMQEQTRELAHFSKLAARGNYEIHIQQGKNPQVRLAGPANLLRRIETQVEKDELRITRERCFDYPDRVRIYVTMPAVTALRLHGAGYIFAQGLQAGELSARLAGSGAIRLKELQAEALHLSLNGSGAALMTGRAARQAITINGAGEVRGRMFTTRRADVTINGSGDVYVRASEHLAAKINGAGDVHYYGQPAQIHPKRHGTGELIQARSRLEPDAP